MFKWSTPNIRECNSDGGTFSSDGSYHSILRHKKGRKNKKRTVTWSKEFQTYEERSLHSFDDDYRDDYNSYDDYDAYDDDNDDDDDDDDDGDASLIADYLLGQDDADIRRYTAEDDKKKKSVTPSSVFTPIEIPADVRLENRQNRRSANDTSLLNTMDSYYNCDISKAASDDSFVSLERYVDEVDGNMGHLGLVMPSLGGFFTALGIGNQPGDASTIDASTINDASANGSNRSSSSDQSDDDTIVKKRTKAAEGHAEARKDIRSAPKQETAKKKEVKSTSELNVALRQLESTESGIEESDSSRSDEVIERLCSDESSENCKKSGEAITLESMKTKKKEKKPSIFGFMNKRKSPGNSKVAKNKSPEKSTTHSSQKNEQDLSDEEVESLVNAALFQEQIKQECAQVKQGVSVTKSIIAEEGSQVEKSKPPSDKKGKEKKRLFKNKLSFRRKGLKSSTGLSGRELEFAFAQLHLAPVEDEAEQQEELEKESSEEVSSAYGGEPVQLASRSDKHTDQQYFHQEGKNKQRNISLKKADTPETKRKETTPMKKAEASAQKVAKQVKVAEEKVIVDQPEMSKRKEMTPIKKAEPSTPKVSNQVKVPNEEEIVDQPETKRKETTPMKKVEPSTPKVAKQMEVPKEKKIVDQPETAKRKETTPVKKAKPSTPKKSKKEKVIVDLPTNSLLRDHLYNDILRGGSFDSVSTTEDILYELEQLEEAAQKMYQSMVMEGEEDE